MCSLYDGVASEGVSPRNSDKWIACPLSRDDEHIHVIFRHLFHRFSLHCPVRSVHMMCVAGGRLLRIRSVFLFVAQFVYLICNCGRSNDQVARGQSRAAAECSQPGDGRDEPLVTLQLFERGCSVEGECCAILRLSTRCKRRSVRNANSKPTRRGFCAGHSAPTVAAACSAASCASNERELGGDLYANITARKIQSAE